MNAAATRDADDNDRAPSKSTAGASNSKTPLYGPFHRLKSPTQTKETAQRQLSSDEIWGKPRRASDIPQVQSYEGELADDSEGIEFFTPTAPDKGVAPGQARWTGPRDGVRVEDDFAKISATITKTRYMDGSDEVAQETASKETTATLLKM